MFDRGISREMVINTIESPEEVVAALKGRAAYQKRFFIEGKQKLLRVFVEEKDDDRIAMNAYLTSKIQKYFQGEEHENDIR